mgnify:CR=1 FL=1
MNKDITLVILAAGMGSRFGGLKQIEPMGPNGEFIIDYSIYDALEAGFNKVVFLIKEENYEIFKETIGARVEPHIKVEYAFQKNDNVPIFFDELKDRQKPLGTAHAILCCKDKVHEPFMIINADDFYGRDAFQKGAEFLKNMHVDEEPHRYGMVGYLVKSTITENGAVKRGVCNVEDGYLTKITESSVGRIEDGTIKAKPLDEALEEFTVAEDDTVSMNMLLFDPSIFGYIDSKFKDFLEKNKENLEKCEFLIPDILFESIEENFATCEVIPTTATWYGVTYKEDAPAVKESIKALVKMNDNEEGDYPLHLWG